MCKWVEITAQGKRWMRNFLELVTQVYKDELSFMWVQAEGVRCHPGGDMGNHRTVNYESEKLQRKG